MERFSPPFRACMGVFLLVAIMLLQACAQLGLQTPQTFNQRIAAGYATVQTVAETAKVAFESGKLNASDRANVVNTSRAAVQGLSLAQAMYAAQCPAGSPSTCTVAEANAKLQATMAILVALQSYVATQGAK